MAEKKVRVSLDELTEKYKGLEYRDFYEKIMGLIKAGDLTPVKRSPLNGKNPPLPVRYTKMIEAEDYSDLTDELKFHFSPYLDNSYYLKHPDIYKKERKYALALSKYFDKYGNNDREPVSVNERSFEIWGCEKFIEKENGRTILKHCGKKISDLSVYETREPLACFTLSREIPQNVIILENEDIFYTMRKYLLRGNDTIFGVKIGTLIYGAGKRMVSSATDYDISVEPAVADTRNNILYFGDLDYEGIDIYEGVSKKLPDIYRLYPFKEAYEKMLERALTIGLTNLPETKEGQRETEISDFLGCFDEDKRKVINDILKTRKYIPQEILNIESFDRK